VEKCALKALDIGTLYDSTLLYRQCGKSLKWHLNAGFSQDKMKSNYTLSGFQ
jgi:hypothetical protein